MSAGTGKQCCKECRRDLSKMPLCRGSSPAIESKASGWQPRLQLLRQLLRLTLGESTRFGHATGWTSTIATRICQWPATCDTPSGTCCDCGEALGQPRFATGWCLQAQDS
eukprot:g11656.t1